MKLIATSIAAIAIGIVVALGSGMQTTFTTPQPPAGVRSLTSTISVSPQLTVAQVARYGRLGYDAIIALRPDGEALDQPGSDEIAAEARSVGLAFAYVPVAPGEISAKTVDVQHGGQGAGIAGLHQRARADLLPQWRTGGPYLEPGRSVAPGRAQCGCHPGGGA